MSEYLFLYRRTPEASQKAMGSPEAAQKSMQKWRAWMQDLTAKGHLKNIGQPLEDTGKVVGGHRKTVTDGPYMETKDVIGGYSIIEAPSLDLAAELAAGCPIVETGGFVEVRPTRVLNL